MFNPSRKRTNRNPRKTNAEPGSGCKIINMIGVPIIKINLKTSVLIFKSIWIELKLLANNSDVVILANSEGCILKLPIEYQEIAPEIFWPKINSPNKLNKDTE